MDESTAEIRPGDTDVDLTGRFRCGAIVRHLIGDGLELVYCRNSSSAEILPSEVASLLAHCGSYRTIDEHAQRLSGGQSAGPGSLGLMKSQLKELANSGFFISEEHISNQLTGPADQSSEPGAISSICVPTCNRPEALKRCLESYIANCKQYGKTNDFVVMDDSQDPEVRMACREMLSTLKTEKNVDIKYAGYEEKCGFLKRLIDTNDLPADVLDFAFFGIKDCGLPTYGTNLNALLLHTIGNTIFTADDDTLCTFAAPPEMADGPAVVTGVYTSRYESRETLLFHDRKAALDSVDSVDACLLELHEQYLGRDLNGCLPDETQNRSVDLDRIDFRFARMLRSGEGRVLVTANGLVGDCAYSHPAECLFFTGPALEAIIKSESDFRTLSVSRECVRMADRVILTDRLPALYSTFLGLDNRQFLPPFSPVARSQDLLFGHLLSQCFYNAYCARLPWALLHEPVEPRSFSRKELVRSHPGMRRVNPLISQLSRSLASGGWRSDPADRLRIIGGYLEDLGKMPQWKFEEFAQILYWQQSSSEIVYLERLMGKMDESRRFFANVVEEYIKNRRARIAEKDDWLPFDVRKDRTAGEALELTMQIVRQFGQLLKWWPDIVESARRLREKGHALAGPV